MYLYAEYHGEGDNYFIIELNQAALQDIKTIAENIPSNLWCVVPWTHGLKIRVADHSEVNKAGIDVDALIAESGDENESMFFNDILVQSEEVNTKIEIGSDWFKLSVENWDGSTSESVTIYFETLKV